MLEDWRDEHDKWAGEKAERLTRLEVRQEGLDHWKRDMQQAALENARSARAYTKFAIAQLIAIAGIIAALIWKH